MAKDPEIASILRPSPDLMNIDEPLYVVVVEIS